MFYSWNKYVDVYENKAYVVTLFCFLQRDPMLLILFLMGRRPELLVPDDVDPNDYEVMLAE